MQASAMQITTKVPVDRNFGVPVDGCAIRSMTISDFATNQVAAEWKDEPCKGAN